MAATTTGAATAATSDECKDDDALGSTYRSCANDPDFAVICAFLQKFAKDLGFDLPNFKQLQEWLTNNDEVSAKLRDFHIKLLRKTRKTVHEKNWESALSKFCFSYSVQDAWEIERFGYKNSSLKVKLRMFRELLECQFERNAKFRALIIARCNLIQSHSQNADSMRTEPIGRDRLGHSYWLTQDDDCNLRIYQEHLDEDIWQVVATNRDELVQLIARLRGNEVVLPSKDIGEVDEDTSSSNSCNARSEKPPPPEEKEDDSLEEETKVPNLKIKLNTGRGINGQSPAKVEQVVEEDSDKNKKVKPLVISQSKLVSASPAHGSILTINSSKKRSLDDIDKSSPRSEDQHVQKKHRPTLLDVKRIKKRSRYETPKSEDDNGQDTDDEPEDSELDDGEEEEGEEDEEEGDVDSEGLEGEEEDIDSAAAEGDENEDKDIEEDDDDDDLDDDEQDDEVGEAIVDPPVIVRGRGAGRDCQAGNPFPFCEIGIDDVGDDDTDVSSLIEEPIMYIYGNGSGADCLVGNKGESKAAEGEPKATFFFGEPGCLKLSPIKQPLKQETKRSIFDTRSNQITEKQDDATEKDAVEVPVDIENEALAPEKTNGESVKFVRDNEEMELSATDMSKEAVLDKEEEIENKTTVIDNAPVTSDIKASTVEVQTKTEENTLKSIKNSTEIEENAAKSVKDPLKMLEERTKVKESAEITGNSIKIHENSDKLEKHKQTAKMINEDAVDLKKVMEERSKEVKSPQNTLDCPASTSTNAISKETPSAMTVFSKNQIQEDIKELSAKTKSVAPTKTTLDCSAALNTTKNALPSTERSKEVICEPNTETASDLDAESCNDDLATTEEITDTKLSTSIEGNKVVNKILLENGTMPTSVTEILPKGKSGILESSKNLSEKSKSIAAVTKKLKDVKELPGESKVTSAVQLEPVTQILEQPTKNKELPTADQPQTTVKVPPIVTSPVLDQSTTIIKSPKPAKQSISLFKEPLPISKPLPSSGTAHLLFEKDLPSFSNATTAPVKDLAKTVFDQTPTVVDLSKPSEPLSAAIVDLSASAKLVSESEEKAQDSSKVLSVSAKEQTVPATGLAVPATDLSAPNAKLPVSIEDSPKSVKVLSSAVEPPSSHTQCLTTSSESLPISTKELIAPVKDINPTDKTQKSPVKDLPISILSFNKDTGSAPPASIKTVLATSNDQSIKDISKEIPSVEQEISTDKLPLKQNKLEIIASQPTEQITNSNTLAYKLQTTQEDNSITKSETITDKPSTSNKTNEVPINKLQAPSTSITSPIANITSAKPCTIGSTSMSTTSILPNRKRRLTDFASAPQPQTQPKNQSQSQLLSMRHSTSESEIDLHSETHEDLKDDDGDDLDVGGKRIKMRPKLPNTELRRKVEAQKTQIEETTSSSGEEDARSRRKIIAPKRKLEKTPERSIIEQPIEAVIKNDTPLNLNTILEQPVMQDKTIGQKLICEKNALVVKPMLSKLQKPDKPTTTMKQKPTLAEIIEKKLKKTSEKVSEVKLPAELTPPVDIKPTVDATPLERIKPREKTPPPLSQSSQFTPISTALSTPVAIVEATTFTPPKKSPITKPLKKNLLTQIRQEESDEEAIPRKRTISESMSPNVTTATITSSELIIQKPEEPILPIELTKMPEEATVQRTSDRQLPDRQRKRRSSEDCKTNELTQLSTTQEEGVSEKMKRSEVSQPPVIEEKPAEVINAELSEVPIIEKEQSPEPVAQSVGRRSGRRGGAAVVYAELPQPKRTRGGAKTAAVENKNDLKVEKVEVKKKIDTKLTTPAGRGGNKAKAKTISPKTENKQALITKAEPISTADIDTKPSIVLEIKPELNTELEAEEIAKSQDAAATTTPKTIKSDPENETPTPRGRGSRNKREVDTTNIIESNDTDTPVRQSRRIAQQKIKEEAERRKLEEIALRTMKQELKKKKKAEKEAYPTVFEPSAESSSSEESEVELKKKAKKKCPGKDGWSSGSEEQADTEEEEEEPPHEESDPGSPLFKSDHEFSPESELEDESLVVPMKRARTARKEDALDGEEDDADEACQKCGKSDHPEWILLCDSCDKGYHCSCLSPVLFYIPEGDWYCPPCQQEQLIVALEQQLKEFDELVARKELEKRLAEAAERQEKERLEEEQRFMAEQKAEAKARKKGKRRGGSGSGGSGRSDDDSDDSDNDSKNSEDDSDDESKASKSINKRAKQEKSEKTKRRRGDGRSNRRAAKRGTRRRQRKNGSESRGSESKSGTGSGSGSDSSSSSSSFSDSDDEPIYKLRKRRQINVSYRLNEYDDLINSALKKEMDEVAGAGNLGRGKDITTIIEADKEEKARLRQKEEGGSDYAEEEEEELDEGTQNDQTKSNNNEELVKNENDNADDDEDDDVPLSIKPKPKLTLKKKPRKLTTLDISSEEDHGSDEDFKTSSFEDDEEDTSISASESDSDSSLEVYRRRGRDGGRGKKQRKAARRAARERRKDRKFVVDESDSEEEARPKSKKKRRDDSDYSESESGDDEDLSELSENMDSADLCDDTTSDSSDGGWQPSKRKKQRKSSIIARKSPKLKKPQVKKVKRVEYSDDDISETEPEEEDDEEDDGVTGSGKGSGKQPRSQPLKTTPQAKTKSPGVAKKKKKSTTSEENSGSDDSTRRTRGRRYAYLEDFDDDSSDGGIKPGVKRPDTPPEERQKFIERQEEIKRMLAAKNAEGAKLAATPRLAPIKGAPVIATDKRTAAKAGDSLSTVPLSVIRQAKVLDIDYLQRKGEAVGDLDNVDDVESEFDDADFPDDLPEDMDDDAIARMVEEEEFSAAAARELPAPDDVLRTNANKSKAFPKAEPPSAAAAPTTQQEKPLPIATAIPLTTTINASGLQEPLRKRLPMPTMHPPLLRHQFPPQHSMPPHHLLQRHVGPPMQLLQNALSAPLGQPLNRNAYVAHPAQQALPPHHPAMHRLPLGLPPGAHGLPPSHPLMQHASRLPMTAAAGAPPPTIRTASRDVPSAAAAQADAGESKPRGRRKKITPLRDPLQKQQTAAAVSASTTVIEKPGEAGAPIKTTTTSVTSLSIAQPPQLYKPPGAPDAVAQPSVITRMPHLPPHGGRAPPPPPVAGMYSASAELHARFYVQPLPPTTGASISRPPPPPPTTTIATSSTLTPTSGASSLPPGPPRHLLRTQMPPGMPPHSALRPTYGPPPPLRGSTTPANHTQPPTSSASTLPSGSLRPPFLHGDHHGAPSLAGVYGAGPPPARHSAPHLNPYRPTIYGNPNFAPRVGPPTGPNMRPLAVDYAAGPRGYPPYGYYAPPPPLTTPAHAQHSPAGSAATSAPSSVIVSAPPAVAPAPPLPPSASVNTAPSTPTNHSVTALTRNSNSSSKPPPTPAPQTTTSVAAAVTTPAVEVKSVITEPRKKLTTLDSYSSVTKSPLTVAGESSGSPAGLQSADAAEDSSSAPGSGATAANAAPGEGQASEFSGLVSYFSSQHDDYNT